MRKTVWIAAIALAVLLLPNAAYACRSDPYALYDVSSLKGGVRPDANANLFDYGIIFEDANDPSCAGWAAVALYKKVRSTLDHPAYWDSNVYKTVGPYAGWLEGANATLVYATALRLGAQGKLTKPLADLIDQVNYTQNIDAFCGFASNRRGQTNVWTSGNSCMDDWAVAASGSGWKAAWKYARGQSATTAASQAKTAIAAALNTTESVCIHKYKDPLPATAPPAGPCTGAISDLVYDNAVAMGLHTGDAIPYGLGLMTSIASADVAISYANQPHTYTSDQKQVAQSLFISGDYHTGFPNGPEFKTNCYQFGLSATGGLTRLETFNCAENYGGPGYQPEMFPVKDFYYKRLGGAPFSFGYDFGYFQESLFCDNINDSQHACGFFSPGRKAIYGTLAQAWVNNRPSLNANLGDYQARFKTYDGLHYISARNGGGSDVNAEATTASTNETFSMVDENGGYLMSGDTVYFQVRGGQYISADNGGGSGVHAVYTTPVTWERFVIQKTSGTGRIVAGDKVSLRTWNGYYLSAMNEGGGDLTALYRGVVTWEVFTITF